MLPYTWRLSIGAVRTALGLGYLAVCLQGAPYAVYWALVPILAYILFSLFALRRSMYSDGYPELTLLIDSVAGITWMAVLTRWPLAGGAWVQVALSANVFVLASAILSHGWLRVAIAGSSFLMAAAIVGPPAPMPVVMIWTALIAAVWVVNRWYVDGRLSRAAQHSVMYRFEAQQAREDERQRIAADFHDGPMQSFIGLQMRLEILRKMLARNPQIAAEELVQLQELCRSQVNELRTFVRSMRPAEVDGASLGASISRMVEQFQKDTGISTSFMSGDYFDPSEIQVSLELLQIVREALNNVQKHAKATRVAVSLNKHGDRLEICVDDNGSGFPFSGSYSLEELDSLRLGPLSIRRRVKALDGELNLESRPGQGAGLKVRVAI